MEVGGLDLGTDPANHVGAVAGFAGNYVVPHLILGPGAHVSLADQADNGNRGDPGGAAEALYVDTVTFLDGTSRLNLNGLHLYYAAINGSPTQILDDPLPEPGTGWLLLMMALRLLKHGRTNRATGELSSAS